MWFIIILLVAVYLVWRFSRSENEKTETNKKSVSHSCHYFGGFNDISVKANHSLFLTFEEENLEFMFNKNGDIFYKNIRYSDIKKVRFMNKTNITTEISLGKMICFGWLSLAMKKEKKNIKEYVVIDVNYDNDSISIILEDEYNNEILSKLKKSTPIFFKWVVNFFSTLVEGFSSFIIHIFLKEIIIFCSILVYNISIENIMKGEI